ncbi:hypothetical protein D9757_010202 [Collybiopsis confluens]|uniref:Uncharacterized protein n=1 Tax=Collybiopsis confluens TaxID=2823264 RepID=A0A8H5GP30_9AGAR|nr:hypothetical protein D9757_010202 [Collybiopsis confluens]
MNRDFLCSPQVAGQAMDDRMLVPCRRPRSPYGSAHSNSILLKSLLGGDHESVQGLQDISPEVPRWDHRTSLHSIFADVSVQQGYLEILSHFLLSVLIACINHIVFTHLDGKEPGSHTSQFWVTVLKNMLPAAVAFLLFVCLKKCLSQAALYCVRLNSYPLELVNLFTSPPSLLNTISILFRPSMQASMLYFAILAAITQAVALTSLFVPGTLAVVPAPFRTQSFEVPTVDFNVFDPVQSAFFENMKTIAGNWTFSVLQFVEPSQRWRQLTLRAASSDTAPTWNPPIGCGSACSYSFSYSAPALNCMELSKKDIWPTGMNTSDSRLVFPFIDSNNLYRYYFYNSTTGLSHTDNIVNPNTTTFVLDVIYMDFHTELDGNLLEEPVDPKQWSPRGVHCTYHNATYEATTEFVNNTQISTTRVKEWHGLLPTGYRFLGPYGGTNTTNATMAFRSIAESFSELLRGDASFIESVGMNTSNTQVVYTPLVSLTGVPNVQDLEGSPSFYFSLAPTLGGNLSAGIQGLLGNVTLAFVNEQTAKTLTEVIVTPNSTQYQYIGWRLGLIYGIVFGFSAVVIASGLFCLQRNRTVAVFDLQRIVEMSATSIRLHELASQPEFGTTLIRGVDLGGELGTRVVLDVSESD